jgi:hypothetical protein
MKNLGISIFALAAFAAPFGPGCKKAEKKANDNLQPAVITQPGMSSDAMAAGHGHAAPTQGSKGGTAAEGAILETMNAGGYTYVHLDTAQGKLWAAAPETAVKVGDKASFTSGMPMAGFRSNSLDRTFDMVYFVPAFTINGAAAAPVAGAKAVVGAEGTGTPPPTVADVKDIKKAEAKDGKTVAELFAAKAEMGGKTVSIRGKVVKYNGGIMGSNWIHLQDGSGAAGTNDITITTKATAKVGDTVLIQGTVGIDKNFGGGYKYGLIVEDASVTVE